MNKARKYINDKTRSENSDETGAAIRDLISLIDDEEVTDVVSTHCSEFKKEHTIEDLADYLHQIKCSANHIDGCSWQYENWDNPGNARKRYLEKAREILRVHNIEVNELHDYIDMYKDITKILNA